MRELQLSGRAAALLLAAGTCAAATGAAPAQAGAALRVPASQSVVVVNATHAAFSRPDAHAPRVDLVRPRRPITGEQTVLPVIARRTGGDGRGWFRVLLPGRPNGHAGWIGARSTRLTSTPWHLYASTSQRLVTVFSRGRVTRRFRAVVGKPSTPTPSGNFFVEETVALGRGLAGAPFALALSARSNVFAQFDGGPGQIALHGLGGVGGRPGTAVSHGCVRLDYGAISWLAGRIGPGVPVTITR